MKISLAKNKYLEAFNLLYSNGLVKSSTDDNMPLKRAAEIGDINTITLLLKDKNTNPAAQDSMSLRLAAQNGHIKVVKLLLEQTNVNPNADNSKALRNAVSNNRYNIVKLLLEDSRTNPLAMDSRPIRLAHKEDYDRIFTLLINDYRVIDNLELCVKQLKRHSYPKTLQAILRRVFKQYKGDLPVSLIKIIKEKKLQKILIHARTQKTRSLYIDNPRKKVPVSEIEISQIKNFF